ncbi:MAG: SDR family oxidoreductase UcpA [Propionibacteriaceae bacterium]|nr:SDR family oxidoreductase UcpA [Propionibacteriaceae bacterium]
MGKLDGKVAIVTGAAMGNGRGAAQKLAENGATVMLLDLNDTVFATAGEIARQTGQKTQAYVVDIRDVARLDEVVDSIITDYSKIDILVNNAGVCNVVPFLEMSDEVRDRMLGVNIIGTWNCSKAVIAHMVEAKYGKIVNLSSVTGPMVVDTGETAYALTKAAIYGLTKALAVEFAASNITVNAVCPGYIATPMAQSIARESDPEHPEQVLAGIAAAVPMGRLGTIEELGDLVAFLASDESRYITGTQVVIDGGSTLPETFSAVGV